MTTQNDRKRGRNPLKMVSDGNFNGFRSFQAILCPFEATKSHFWAGTQNCCKLVLWHLKTITRRAEIWWRWFRMSLSTHLGHFEKKSVILEPVVAIFGPKMTQDGLKWPEPIEIAIWNHLQWISASLAVILSGHMTSLRQFWVWGQNWLKLAKKGPKWPKLD